MHYSFFDAACRANARHGGKVRFEILRRCLMRQLLQRD